MVDNELPSTYNDKYAFNAEWYNEIADVTKSFILSFYPMDNTLELFDVKYNRMFLRRTKIEEIDLKSLFVGATVNIFCRKINIIGFANYHTERILEKTLQRIVFIIKPDVFEKAGEIIEFFEKEDFKLSRIKMGCFTKEGVEKYFGDNNAIPLSIAEVQSLTKGPSVVVEALAERSKARWIKELCSTESDDDVRLIPIPLQALLGSLCIHSALNFSYHSTDIMKKLEVWFPRQKSAAGLINSTFSMADSTCCIIKPHAVNEKLIGEIMKYICLNGFRICAMETIHLDRHQAEMFYQIYRKVVPEYACMVSQLASCVCVVLEVSHITDASSSAKLFRQLCGPADPEVARRTHTNSIRAKFGSSTVLNAVHCTDLPEDAKLEVEFFFKCLLR